MLYLDKMIFRYNLLYTDQYKIFYILNFILFCNAKLGHRRMIRINFI